MLRTTRSVASRGRSSSNCQLLRSLLSLNPYCRPTADEALESEWLARVGDAARTMKSKARLYLLDVRISKSSCFWKPLRRTFSFVKESLEFLCGLFEAEAHRREEPTARDGASFLVNALELLGASWGQESSRRCKSSALACLLACAGGRLQ